MAARITIHGVSGRLLTEIRNAPERKILVIGNHDPSRIARKPGVARRAGGLDLIDGTGPRAGPPAFRRRAGDVEEPLPAIQTVIRAQDLDPTGPKWNETEKLAGLVRGLRAGCVLR